MMTASTIYDQFKDWSKLNESFFKKETNTKKLQPLSLTAKTYTYGYIVTECLTSKPYYVGSDISLSTGNTINFFDLSNPSIVNCGEIIDTYSSTTLEYEYITTFTDCNDCLSGNTKLVLIESCLDGSTGPTYVSPLYNVGDILFLDFYDTEIDGFVKSCFTIIEELPYEEIPIPWPSIEYKPIENCESCVSCNGVYYVWEDCLNPDITGVILSNQYMSVGDVFALPIYGEGEEIIGVSPCKTVVLIPSEGPYSAVSGSPVVHSTILFNNCEDCITQMVDVLPGNVDTAFIIGSGFNGGVNTIKKLSDGKILLGGDFTLYDGTTANRIIRLNSDGSIDTSFVTGTGFNSTVNTLDVQSNGKIIVGGEFTSYDGNSYNKIIRLNSDGSIDTSFVIGTGFDNGISSLDIQSDNKILVVGYFTLYDGTSANRIVRLNSDGSIDTSFVTGTGFNGSPYIVSIQSNGQILVGGVFTSYDGNSYNRIIRLNSDGSVDTSFVIGTGFDNGPRSITLQADDKILLGGYFTNYDGTTANYIIRLNSDGSIDTSFVTGTGFNAPVFSTSIYSDGKIIVGGVFTSYDGNSYNRIIRLNSDGSVDTSFVIGTGFDSGIFSIDLQPDGKILLGGDFTSYDGITYNEVIRLFGEEIPSIYNLYNFTTCDGDSSYIYLQESLYTTDIIKGNLNNTPVECGYIISEVTGLTANTFSLYYSDGTTTYENCDSCVSTVRYKATIKDCVTNEVKYVTMTQSSIDQIINSGSIFSDGGIECYEMLDYCIIPNNVEMSPYLFYDNCELCLAPLSSNTESLVCIVDCSGNTISVTPPHPVYTNLRGKAVVQLNMITLGGENGLNS
jgi:uncharacterized delta-60 repeat protein